MSLPAFDPAGALRVLSDHDVRFVLIGGLAGRLWGSPTMTNDLDICYSRDPDNLERLAAALGSMEARLRGVDDEVPFRLDPATLAAGDSFTFVTTMGNLDILGTPTGTAGFDDLVRAATTMNLAGVDVLVVDIEDLLRMKLAAARAKDLVEAEILAALRDQLNA